MSNKLAKYSKHEFIGILGYSLHIFNGRKLMPYRGIGDSTLDTIPDLNTARKIACVLLPKESKTRYVIIYHQGTTVGKMVHKNGEYLYNPAYYNGIGEFKNKTYAVNPRSGRVIKTYDAMDLSDFGRSPFGL